MRGKLIPVRAKKTIEGVFNEGEELHIQSVLLDEPKYLHGRLAIAVLDNKALGITNCTPELKDEPVYTKDMMDKYWKNGQHLVKVCEDTYAEIGTYSHTLILTNDGRELSDKILGNRRLDYAFEKI